MTAPAIELRDLRKNYALSTGEEIFVLRGVDLSVRKGEFVALMGESGSGKSTLLNVVGMLHFPTSGTYLLDGENVSDLSDDEEISALRSRKFGFVFQQFHLLPHLTALENVALPATFADVPAKERDRRALDLIDRVKLPEKADSLPGELSGGQQQRVAIARALMNDPEILLADEPTGNLDSATTASILKILQELHAEGKTIVMVTHSKEVASIADRIVHLKDGKVEK